MSPKDIRFEKYLGVMDGTVDMRLGRHVDYSVNRIVIKYHSYLVRVGNISLHKKKAFLLLIGKCRQVIQVSCVGEIIYPGYRPFGMQVKIMVDKIAADKACDSCDK